MFLKRIEMQGFKSFADRVVINFDCSISGIVGPNGCGKSNITDAIRWVLGEQSSKSLRGTSMQDVIFAGSADRRKVNMAEVTLVFDNSQHMLNSNQDEIEITRRLYRNNNEAEYLINRNFVRLRDIQDLILDTGLGKDALSMISQGNIQAFADAKPLERRAIFEEAAGVSKYKKRKVESLAKLERCKSNIERLEDILQELERQVSPLKRQAKRAERYREKKQRLEEIETYVLVAEIDRLNSELQEGKQTIFDIETKISVQETTIQVHETKTQDDKQQINNLEHEINSLQEKLMNAINEIQTLETRKIEIDEKRKYAIEQGNNEEKAKQLSILLQEAKNEFDDREQRLNTNQNSIKLYQEQLGNIALEKTTLSAAKEQAAHVLRKLENRKSVLDNLAKDPFTSHAGVKSIVDNIKSLNGVLGVIGKVITPISDYEEAISVALGNAIYHLVTHNTEQAKAAIAFLKKNRSGRATFLPIEVAKPHLISKEHEIICQNTSGYLGVAFDFVENEPVFDPIVDCLLGNVLVVDTIDNGTKLAELINYRYKIVTLDGDVIHKGGSITGGKTTNSTSIITLQKEIKDLTFKITSQQAECTLNDKNYYKLIQNKEEIERQLMTLRINNATLEQVVDAKRAKYEKLKNDYELLKPNDAEEIEHNISFHDEIINKLNEAYCFRDQATTEIKSKREYRMKLVTELDRKEQQIRQIRKELGYSNSSLSAINVDLARIETKLENNLQRLATEYQMTYEFAKTKINGDLVENAKEEVLQLRADIERLGNINMEAPEQYQQANERYEFLDKQLNDLKLSRDKILDAIDDMDKVMVKQFKTMFDKINLEFNETFKFLFQGGKAKLILEDATDILNTGIDIDVQPPGKSVQNIRLFSGGEKSLIAICLLFAILKVRPVPLCIFDEVEAALDQANVERFAKYIKQFNEDTQFIIVTHRSGTMEECEILYGVTMQKQGVSQMLKVELFDAIAIADENGGN